jgi:hypothetical protein
VTEDRISEKEPDEMTQQAGPQLTLHDLAADLQWVTMLGWSDDQLRSVPVYEAATGGDETINLADFGGTSLGLGEAGSPSSADARAIPNMYVYRHDTPPECWRRLKEIADQGGPSGYNQLREIGETEDVSFPPLPPRSPGQ